MVVYMEAHSDTGQPTDDLGPSVADRALRITTALAAEVAALRERLAVVERLAADRQLFTSADVDDYRPDEPTAANFRVERIGLIKRVFGALQA